MIDMMMKRTMLLDSMMAGKIRLRESCHRGNWNDWVCWNRTLITENNWMINKARGNARSDAL